MTAQKNISTSSGNTDWSQRYNTTIIRPKSDKEVASMKSHSYLARLTSLANSKPIFSKLEENEALNDEIVYYFGQFGMIAC